MTVRAMTLQDLEKVLDWAADEGWNPGLEDAPAFWASDPSGFFIKKLDGDPVAAISVVNHDSNFAFLGLYLCRPDYRGQGYGMEVWRAGIAHAGTRSIALDGVPDQQMNYARSGFVKCGSTIRFEGHVPARHQPRVRLATHAELPSLVERDMNASGMHRVAFATAWLDQMETRKTVVLVDGTTVTGFATFRHCRTGIKVGPFHATTDSDADALLASNPFEGRPAPYFIDVQEHGSPLAGMLTSRGFEATFETARMVRGKAPKAEAPAFHAIASMELG
ncbi:GNAT family N-acetyltransferase [Jannaschia sp. M317]|uniref:GNAT family N-acetyltransferase n=1 Tax=Jannaschia sp. M317 TaxID=2867011 RepID=UPI0021A76ADC|nr:GNAT family N-acetyltransferase [Jannaschia sp. M317]UWQ19079.1 GNAT family N-acetyltransferase [Jannaschia sp. M317]